MSDSCLSLSLSLSMVQKLGFEWSIVQPQVLGDLSITDCGGDKPAKMERHRRYSVAIGLLHAWNFMFSQRDWICHHFRAAVLWGEAEFLRCTARMFIG